jgi:NTP pyrophosphatase (non-canonical NTP hydrolase)
MEAKLAQREDRGSWLDESVLALCEGLNAEVDELDETLTKQFGLMGNPIAIGTTDETPGEAIDVANYAMFLWDKARHA